MYFLAIALKDTEMSPVLRAAQMPVLIYMKQSSSMERCAQL